MRKLLICLYAAVLCACAMTREPDLEHRGPGTSDNKVELHLIRNSTYQAVDRKGRIPVGYGLYSYVLLKAQTENALLLLSEIFATTGPSGDTMIPKENLNLILIPTKDAVAATRAMESGRSMPRATAQAVVYKFYDYDYAEWLIGKICNADRGTAILETCCDAGGRGPIIVTSDRPIHEQTITRQRLLVINMEFTHPAAVPEVLAAYKQQISRKDFADHEVQGWRLKALDLILSVADLVPKIKKAMAAEQ